MPLRQLVGLLTAAFSLHLNVLAADSACATHAGASAMAGASHHGSAAQGHAKGSGGEAGDRVSEPCRTPSQPNCCEATATCSTVAVSSRVPSVHDDIAPGSAIDRATGTLLTRFIAPETPPPKA